MLTKGIILAGGSGTRLQPLTSVVCKQLLPIYDKPMIYYPLSTLMLLGIRRILIISTPTDTPTLERVLGDGSDLGIRLQYAVQPEPNGLAEAFLIGADFIDGQPVCLMLGDNLLHWGRLGPMWTECTNLTEGAYILGIHTSKPERFAIIEVDEDRNIISLEEKPAHPKSNIAVIGLYFYDDKVVEYARSLKPSARGELEITDLNNIYLRNGQLKVQILSRGTTWLDAGTFDSMMDASNFIQIIEIRQSLKIGCIEEVAYNMTYINRDQLLQLAERFPCSPYGDYLHRLVQSEP